jgi:MATE family multidrug resistance protein
VNKRILHLAIPNILSNLSIPLLGMVDTALMGHLEDERHLGAIALGGILFNFIYWGFAFLRMGTTGMTAQAFGRKDMSDSILTLSRAMLVAIAGSLLIILLQLPIAWLGFSLLEGDADVEAIARAYFRIRIWAAPASLGLYAFHGWFLGMQNARFPMVLTILVNLLNIAFSLLFIYHFGLKSDGVALGTVCAQYLGLATAIFLFFWKYKKKMPRIHLAEVLDLVALRRFFSVNADIFIRTILLVFSFAFFTSKSAAIGNSVLAANQVLLQYFFAMSYAVDGFAYAAESLIGRFRGEADEKGIRHAVRLLFLWGMGFGLLFALIYLVGGNELLYLFTDNPDVMEAAKPYLLWLALLPLAGSAAFMWDGVYIGATETRTMRNTMLIATLLIFLPAYYLTVPHIGNHALWLAMNAFMLARAVLLWGMAGRRIYR